jgi:hypothetical protein
LPHEIFSDVCKCFRVQYHIFIKVDGERPTKVEYVGADRKCVTVSLELRSNLPVDDFIVDPVDHMRPCECGEEIVGTIVIVICVYEEVFDADGTVVGNPIKQIQALVACRGNNTNIASGFYRLPRKGRDGSRERDIISLKAAMPELIGFGAQCHMPCLRQAVLNGPARQPIRQRR